MKYRIVLRAGTDDLFILAEGLTKEYANGVITKMAILLDKRTYRFKNGTLEVCIAAEDRRAAILQVQPQ